jgi:diguanylate cyclase (GGDEF)-like protein
VCRTGGEEFAVIAPHIDTTLVPHLAQRLVEAVGSAGIGPDGRLTVSAGLAIAPAETTDPTELFRLADERLLAAKAAGKNRAVAGA